MLFYKSVVQIMNEKQLEKVWISKKNSYIGSTKTKEELHNEKLLNKAVIKEWFEDGDYCVLYK